MRLAQKARHPRDLIGQGPHGNQSLRPSATTSLETERTTFYRWKHMTMPVSASEMISRGRSRLAHGVACDSVHLPILLQSVTVARWAGQTEPFA